LAPAATDWFVHIDPSYPLGRIKLYPAEQGGLHHTFPHQSYNAKPICKLPWRQGDLCLDSPDRRPLGRYARAPEPLCAHGRLRWHVHRARAWLEAAAEGTLLEPGHPYELPAWPPLDTGRPTVVFAEGEDSFTTWRAADASLGYATLTEISDKHLAVLDWTDLRGRLLAQACWGHAIMDSTTRSRAVWLRLREPPMLPPWEAPPTWGALRRAARMQGVSLDSLLRQIAARMRGRGAFLLLVGFPIPKRVGGAPCELHWQPLQVPALGPPQPEGGPRHRVRRNRKLPQFFLPGFRDDALGRWQHDREVPLADKRPIVWLKSENWHSDRIGARGRVMERLRRSRIAIVGVGAIGSLMAELLIRGGAEDLLLIDGDDIEVGNLARHRLRMDSLAARKATSLAEDLNITSPHARVHDYPSTLPTALPDARALLEDQEVVLDCTAEATPLQILSQITWDNPKLFASISVGLEARRLYFFAARGLRFPLEMFDTLVAPWLDEERERTDVGNLPWAGAGCWHPHFPARLDDLMLMAATALKLLEAEAAVPHLSSRLQIFERATDPSDTFQGLFRLERGPST
jgi:molybdopterin/thiamine biosynthesis adenylyltransferase